ncbi:hypothetical protein WN51_12054 [Melipona quadrifasciata]|uniref:Uncharacterized protein n=1 Tax=Melipona quadrifasciata TaxID=166423 RepID=A0A0M9A2A6_9HYME|nr:hypothetical protein WN51_12054 [Melipona quadrifasciata]
MKLTVNVSIIRNTNTLHPRVQNRTHTFAVFNAEETFLPFFKRTIRFLGYEQNTEQKKMFDFEIQDQNSLHIFSFKSNRIV